MKNLILIIAILFSTQIITQAQTAMNNPTEEVTTHSLKVNVKGFASNDGKVYIGLYNKESDWLRKRIQSKVEKIEEFTTNTTFENIPAGTYAISLYHDENDNGKLDVGYFSIPKEPTASSNNAKAYFGPPKWADAKFIIDENTKEITIQF